MKQAKTKNNNAMSFGKSMGKFIKFLKPYYVPLIIAIIFAIFGTAFNIIAPDKIGEITNIIQRAVATGTAVNLDKIHDIGIMLVCLFIGGAILSYFQGFIITDVVQRASKKMRTQIYAKINRLPLKYYDSRPFGDTLSRVTNDVDTIGTTFNQSVVQLLSGVTLLIGSVIMMFVTCWQLAIVALVVVPLGTMLVGAIMKFSQKYFISQQKELGQLNGIIEETYSGQNIVAMFNAQKMMKNDFDEVNNKLCKSQYKSQFVSGIMMPLMEFVGNIGYVAVCIVGGMLFLDGKIEIGAIVSFIIYIKIFTQPLATIAQSVSSMQSTAAASGRVFEFLEEEEMPAERPKLALTKVKGNIDFEDVHFGYNNQKMVLDGFTAHIKAGQKVALVAPTGAGKTTLVNLLMKFYEINSGDIKIDGVSIKDLSRENVRQLFGMVLQDTWQFEGTIYDNIVFNTKNVTHEEVEDACKRVGLDHFIRTLPQGYNTYLDDTVSLSAGQKQLLTIARAMVHNAPMLILDEATSSVDTRTEQIIARAMDELAKDKTSIVIAHRLSTIKNSDQILVIAEGKVLESGTHDELIAQNGKYAELYNSQF